MLDIMIKLIFFYILALGFGKIVNAEPLQSLQSHSVTLPIGMKVVPLDEICTKPSPCAEPVVQKKEISKEESTKDAIKDLDRKLSFKCPPCRKGSIQYVDKIVEKVVEKPVYKTIERNIEVPKIVKETIYVDKPIMQRHSFYLLGGLGQDGLSAEEAGDREYVLWAKTYYTFVGTIGYSYKLTDHIAPVVMIQTNKGWQGGFRVDF